MSPHRSHHVRPAHLFVAPLLLAGVILAACSSSSTSSTTTTASPSTTTGASGGTGGTSVAQLHRLSDSVKASQQKTFKAVYTSTTGGTSQSYTLEQAPPKQLFSATGGSQGTTMLVNTGSATYTCFANSGAGTTCTSVGSTTGTNALSGILDIYNGSAELSAISSWESITAAHVVGAKLSVTNATIAGQSSTCAQWTYQGQTTTYCVTSDGVLAKVSASGASGNETNFVLASYTTSVPDSDFALPAGATVVTLPSGS